MTKLMTYEDCKAYIEEFDKKYFKGDTYRDIEIPYSAVSKYDKAKDLLEHFAQWGDENTKEVIHV